MVVDRVLRSSDPISLQFPPLSTFRMILHFHTQQLVRHDASAVDVADVHTCYFCNAFSSQECSRTHQWLAVPQQLVPSRIGHSQERRSRARRLRLSLL
jgi:hypothetical protein